MGWNPSKTFEQWGNTLGFKHDAATSDMNQQKDNIQKQHDANTGVVGQMKQDDNTFQTTMSDVAGTGKAAANNAFGDWNRDSTSLQAQAGQEATDAKQVYTGTVQPQLKNIMETAQQNAGSAMSLKDYQDPNNAVQTAYRNMYEQQAQGVNREGMADAGVLGAMGTQATANVMGNGMPMTGGQLAAIQGMNMTQASGAVANAQQYAQQLRQQGIQTGIQQNDKAYGAGQEAQKAYADSVNNIQSADNSYRGVQSSLRGEQQGYADARLTNKNSLNNYTTGMDMGTAALNHSLAEDQGNRQIGLNNALYGGQNGVLGQQAQMSTAQGAANQSFFGGVLGAGAGMVGGKGGTAAAAAE